MDYYESVVIDYLRADRALFVNTECCIQITPGHSSNKGTFWYCDAVVADLRSKTVLLCEISYSLTLATLIKRLQSWSANWDGMRSALERDSCLPKDWLSRLRPWLFVPERCIPSLLKGLSRIGRESPVSTPRITPVGDGAAVVLLHVGSDWRDKLLRCTQTCQATEHPRSDGRVTP